jgi:hypothetical protein
VSRTLRINWCAKVQLVNIKFLTNWIFFFHKNLVDVFLVESRRVSIKAIWDAKFAGILGSSRNIVSAKVLMILTGDFEM